MRHENYNLETIIGIDPDLHNSGIAFYDVATKKFTSVKTITMLRLMMYLEKHESCHRAYHKFILEYPDSTNTWHKGGGRGTSLNVGKNQAVAIIIKEAFDELKLNYELVRPAGYSQSFKNKGVFERTTGWTKRTNEDARAAAAIVWFNK